MKGNDLEPEVQEFAITSLEVNWFWSRSKMILKVGNVSDFNCIVYLFKKSIKSLTAMLVS